MFAHLPLDPQVWMDWKWDDLAPYYADLKERQLDAASLETFLSHWSRIDETVDEIFQRLYVAQTSNTVDPEIEARYNAFIDGIYPGPSRPTRT